MLALSRSKIICFFVDLASVTEELWLLHHHFGHLYFGVIKIMFRSYSDKIDINDIVFETCALAKHKMVVLEI